MLFTTIIAKAIAAAPRRPATESIKFWLVFVLNGLRSRNTARGLATKNINSIMTRPRGMASIISLKSDKSPNKKNIAIWKIVDRPS